MTFALRLLAIGCIAAGLSHVFLGPTADMMLGANISPDTLGDASLDSQNRFYGAAFTLYGSLFWLTSTDLDRHGTVLKLVLATFFFGGVARLISIVIHGWPSPIVIGLLISELVLPTIFLFMLARRNKDVKSD